MRHRRHYAHPSVLSFPHLPNHPLDTRILCNGFKTTSTYTPLVLPTAVKSPSILKSSSRSMVLTTSASLFPAVLLHPPQFLPSATKINFQTNEQKEPWFIKINPNGRIPAIVDRSRGGLTVSQCSRALPFCFTLRNTTTRSFASGSTPPPIRKTTVRCSNGSSSPCVGSSLIRHNKLTKVAHQHGGVGPMQGQGMFSDVFIALGVELNVPVHSKSFRESRSRRHSIC